MIRTIAIWSIGIFLAMTTPSFGQQKISLEEIFAEAKFYTRSIPSFRFMKDGRHYTQKVGNKIVQFDIVTGEETGVILDVSQLYDRGLHHRLDGYVFSEDERKLLLRTQTKRIYRRSKSAYYFVYDLVTEQLLPIDTLHRQRYCHFNPQGDKVAYVRDNDLYYLDLNTKKTTRITDDGKYNSIINGAADWVYEEEFSLTRAFEWSPDGDQLGFIRFDETAVPEFTMTLYRDGDYPEYEKFKYPKVGAANAIVKVKIFNTITKKMLDVALDSKEDRYIPRIKWTTSNTELCITELNRHQNELRLYIVNSTNGEHRMMFQETNAYYLKLHDNLYFMPDGQHFIWTSEGKGYNHIYLYEMWGKKIEQLTFGSNEVTKMYGYDAANNRIYFQRAELQGIQRSVYGLDVKNKKINAIADELGSNEVMFSPTFDFYIYTYSNANTPPVYEVRNRSGEAIRVLENNATLKAYMDMYDVQPVEITSIPNATGEMMNAVIIYPANFDSSKTYPLFMHLYGGPGSQKVKNKFNSIRYYWWFQMLSQQGYIIAVVDNRGTGGRGQAFKKMTYMKLGEIETRDQIDAATYLGKMPFVDASRIGIFGWSYGGYMSSLCLLKGNDVFKMAIAVAPVTNWKWYDSIYTERFMRTEKENPDGYRNNSPVYFADRLKGDYLIVHGLADDNVHFQHTAEMTKQLIKANKQFETYLYPNRNHGIYGDHARIHLFTKMTDFIHRKL